MEDKSFPNYGCHVDGCEGERCVLDPLSDCNTGCIEEDCNVGRDHSFGLTKFDYFQCPNWKLVEEKQTYFEHTCPCCGHRFDS